VEAILNEIKERIENIERQVGLLPKPWLAKSPIKKPVAKKK